MAGSRRSMRPSCTAAFLSLALLAPPSADAQVDSSLLHATLRGWNRTTWLLLEDRAAISGGRLTAGGIQHRFNDRIDAEYQLDLISSRFGLSEEYRWQQHENGLRYWTGSINQKELVSGADFKVVVPLSGRWSAQAVFDQHDSPTVGRSLLRIRFAREFGHNVFAYAEGSFHPVKPDADITIGTGYKTGSIEASVAFTVLDAFNDLVYQVLEVFPSFSDTALDYGAQPLGFRSTIETTVGPGIRIEAHGGIMTPARMRAFRQLAPDSGFNQSERFGYVGGMLEWSALPSLRVGAFGTYVRSVLDRTPLPQSDEVDDFRLVERTTRAGAFFLARAGARWLLEGFVDRNWRPETRDYRTDAAQDVDYEDRAWSGQFLLGYRALGGFSANIAFEMDIRDVVRGDRQVPQQEPLGRHNTRVRTDVGWRFERMWLLVGYRSDIDGDSYITNPRGLFDGAHGRFELHW